MTGATIPPLTEPANAVAAKDVARTFGEADVSLAHSQTWVSDGSIKLPEPAMLANETGYGGVTEAGVVIEPNRDLTALEITAYGDNGEASDGWRIVDDSSGTVLYQDTSPVAGGATVSASGLSLTAGSAYRVYLADSGGFGASGAFGASADGYAASVVDGWQNGGRNGGALGIAEVGTPNPAATGTCVVEWPAPEDVFAWDVATFTRSLDGEAVDVYVEESTDGSASWSEIAGPIQRGDGIPASGPEANIRFRVELSRSTTAASPTLDSLARRYKL